MELFWRHGYEGVSIATLTQALQIAAPSLYSAFGSKAALYREALDLYQREQSATHEELMAEGPLKEVIARFLRAAVRAVTDPERPAGCMISTGMFACAPENHGEAAFTAALRQGLTTQLQKRLQRARAAGELPATAKPIVLARYLTAVLQGISIQARDGASRRELLALVDQVLGTWPV